MAHARGPARTAEGGAMKPASHSTPEETTGREVYYTASMVEIVLICRECGSSLDPDVDLGPNHSFKSDRYYYYVRLGDEAYKLGWLVEYGASGDYPILCPLCAAKEPK